MEVHSLSRLQIARTSVVREWWCTLSGSWDLALVSWLWLAGARNLTLVIRLWLAGSSVSSDGLTAVGYVEEGWWWGVAG